MIFRDYFPILTDEQKLRYALECCEYCAFYESCELVNDYIVKQMQKNKSALPVETTKIPIIVNGKEILANATIVNLEHDMDKQNRSAENLPFYMREVWENGVCPMKGLYQVECGSQWVADGIGDDFKVDLKYDFKTERFRVDKSSHKWNYMTNKWEPRQAVYISAQTGNGKNHFIENGLLKYVRELNHKYKTQHKILILSNRIALRLQVKDRLEKGVVEDDQIYYSYKEYADVMSYQSLLKKSERLKEVQNSKNSNYIFVICDEAHFFTSDAMFNPDTEKILEAIINIFADAIRVYMTATPDDCIKYIQAKESWREKHKLGVLYHFKRDYRYLNTKYFSEEAELRDIITNSVINGNEKWLIFIDNKKQGVAFKKLLEYENGEGTALKGKVFTIDADSKYYDKKYQEMILNERFDKNVNVLISTSVIDNGVNFRDIENVVITDLDRTKCLQMVGRVRVDKDPNTKAVLSKVTLYIKRHNKSFLSKRLKSLGVQQDAYHDFDLAAKSRNYKYGFLEQYYDNDLEDWEGAKHWFGRDKKEPDRLYINEIAHSLADKYVQVYESILQEMAETEKGKKVTGQRFLEFQLSWFGKKYSKRHDLTLNGYKTDGLLSFEKWIHDEWLDKTIPKEAQKDFGKKFFANYNPLFGLCTKKQGFSTDDNRGKNGPKTAGYSFKRIGEIFQVRKMPYTIIEENGGWIIATRQDGSKQ